MPLYEADRTCQIRVLLGAGMQDVTQWVTGSITVEESTDTPVVTASIPVQNSLLPWFQAGSWSVGPQPLEIWVRIVTATADDWIRVFKGTTEVSQNTGVILPTGALKAVSDAYAWANHSGCLLTSPFSGNTRVELLEDFLTNAGVTAAIDATAVTSTVVKRAVDISGTTPIALLERWGPVDGWVWREEDGGIELLALADVAGPTCTPLYALTWADYEAVTESDPVRPVTHWVITGHEPILAPDGTETTTIPDAVGTGSTDIIRTIANGAMTQEITERTEDYVVRGVTDAASANLLVKRVTVDFVHDANGDGDPTGRLTSKITTTETYYAPKASTGVGNPPYTFQDGSFHTVTDETFQEVEKTTETYTWDTDECYLKTGDIETKRWAAPISETSFSDATNTWPDGSDSPQTEETYQVVFHEYWTEELLYPDAAFNSTLSTYFGNGYGTGITRARMEGRERGTESGASVQLRRDYEIATLWAEAPDGLTHQKWVRSWPGSNRDTIGCSDQLGLSIGDEAGYATVIPTETREDIEGPAPLPPTESGVGRMYSMRPILQQYVVSSSLPVRVSSEYSTDIEADTEATRYAKWMARLAYGVQVDITMPPQPQIKRWDPVTFTDSARNCTARQGWVKARKMAFDPLSGAQSMVLTVILDSFAAVAP